MTGQGVNRVSDIDRQRRRRRIGPIIALAILASLVFCWLLAGMVLRAPKREFLRLVRVGMARDEVRAAVGEPDQILAPGPPAESVEGRGLVSAAGSPDSQPRPRLLSWPLSTAVSILRAVR